MSIYNNSGEFQVPDEFDLPDPDLERLGIDEDEDEFEDYDPDYDYDPDFELPDFDDTPETLEPFGDEEEDELDPDDEQYEGENEKAAFKAAEEAEQLEQEIIDLWFEQAQLWLNQTMSDPMPPAIGLALRDKTFNELWEIGRAHV